MSISSRITAMQEHLQDDYDVLDLAGADLTNVDKNIVNLKPTWKERLLYFMNNGTDVVWENWDKVTGEGTSLTLNNTLEAKMGIELKGNTYQNSTTGKNKASNVYSDYTYTGSYAFMPITLEQGQTYTMSATRIGELKTNYYNYGIVKDGTSYSTFVGLQTFVDYATGTTSTKTITVDASYTSPKLVCYIQATDPQTKFDELFSNYEIQFEKSNTATSYEPYTNGASPNPDYPQEVHTVSGDNEINICGKNLAKVGNGDISASGYSLKISNSLVTLTTTATENSFDLCNCSRTGAYLPSFANANDYHLTTADGGTYKLSLSNKTATITGTANQLLSIMTNQRRIDCYIGYDGSFFGSTSFTLQTEEYVKSIYLWTNGTTTLTKLEFSLQLERGSTATEYEKYNISSYLINLGVENLINSVEYNRGVNSNGGFTSGTDYLGINDYVACKPNTTYTITFEHNVSTANLYVGYKDTNGNFINREGYQLVRTFKTPSNAYSMFFYLNKSGVTFPTIGGYVILVKGSKPQQISDTPIELCKIGDYQDKFIRNSGKNLLDRSACEENKALTWATGVTWNDTGSLASDFIKVNIGDKIYANYNYQKMFYDKDKNYLGCLQMDGTVTTGSNGNMASNFVVPNVSGIVYMRLGLRTSSNPNINLLTANIMVNKGDTLLDYEPYGNGEWYLEKKVRKVVLNGSESGWANMYLNNQGLGTITVNLDGLVYQSNNSGICNYFIYKWVYNNPTPCFYIYNEGTIGRIMFVTQFTTKQDFITWLGTHNTEVYYVLATPTYTKIEGELANQLDKISGVKSYNSQTNISQENNDLASILNATALEDM